MVKKKIISKVLGKWWRKVKRSFLKKLPWSLISVMFVPIFVLIMSNFLLYYSFFATLGYIFTCIRFLDRIIEDIKKPIIWAVGYGLFSVGLGLMLSSVIPKLTEGTAFSIFSALVMFIIIGSLMVGAHKLKKK